LRVLLHAGDHVIVAKRLAVPADVGFVEVEQGLGLQRHILEGGLGRADRDGGRCWCRRFNYLHWRLFWISFGFLGHFLFRQARITFFDRHGRRPVASRPAFIVAILDHITLAIG
jgi:hypothetical protein